MAPRLIINPRSDDPFRDLAERIASDGFNRHEVERQLRLSYPAAVVRERGLSGEAELYWYVYRDGRWVPD